MVKFKVSTEALRAAAHELRVCAGVLAIAAECHRDASRLEFVEQSVLALVEPGHEARVRLLQRRLDKASTTLSSTALALADTARRYDAGSVAAVRLLDPEDES